jgi:hypothetical protein
MAFLQRGGAIVVTVPAGQSIAVGALRGSQAQVLIPSGLSGGPISLVNNATQTFGPFINGASISVSCISGTAEYVVDVAPLLTDGSGGSTVVAATVTATGILQASTLGQIIPVNSATNVTLTLPPAAAAFAANPFGLIVLSQLGVGVPSFQAGGSDSLRATSGIPACVQYGMAAAQVISSTEWALA